MYWLHYAIILLKGSINLSVAIKNQQKTKPSSTYGKACTYVANNWMYYCLQLDETFILDVALKLVFALFAFNYRTELCRTRQQTV